MPKFRRRGKKKTVDRKQNQRIANLEYAVNPEVKDTGFGQDYTAFTGTFSLQFGVLLPTQGVLSTNRIGFDYSVHGIDLGIQVAQPINQSFNYFQCWLMQDMGLNGSNLSDAELRYTTTTAIQNALGEWNSNRVYVPGMKNPILRGAEKNRVKILWDSGLRMTTPFDTTTADNMYMSNKVVHTIKKRLRFRKPKHCKCIGTGSTIASAGPGVIQLVYASNDAQLTIAWTAIQYFTDG